MSSTLDLTALATFLSQPEVQKLWVKFTKEKAEPTKKTAAKADSPGKKEPNLYHDAVVRCSNDGVSADKLKTLKGQLTRLLTKTYDSKDKIPSTPDEAIIKKFCDEHSDFLTYVPSAASIPRPDDELELESDKEDSIFGDDK